MSEERRARSSLYLAIALASRRGAGTHRKRPPSSHQRSVSRCLRASARRYMRELLVAALGGLLIVKSLTESQLVANHFGLLQALFILCTIKH